MSKKNKFAAELFPKVLFVSILGLAAIAVRAGESCANVDICVCDIYGGELMKSVKRGEIKKLRVVENLEASGNSRGFWEGARKQSPGIGYYDGILLAPLGTANVGRDGSARFCAPAGKKLFCRRWTPTEIWFLRRGLLTRPSKAVLWNLQTCPRNRSA